MAWSLAFRFARRELRGGLGGFRIFLACLMLGVAVIAAVGSVAASVRGGIAADARTILGGDVELRLLYQPAKPEQLAVFATSAAVSASEEMRAMSRPAVGDERALVELKAVDAAYPLYGSVALQPAMPLADALAERDGRWGAAVDPNLLERLGLKVGDSLRVGDAAYQIRATIAREPDRGAGIFILGPRLLVADGSLAATGLVQPGSLVYYVYRIRLPAGTNAASWIEQLKARFPDAVWRIRGLDDAAAGIRQFIDRTAMFLILVGLAALLVGGVGVGTAVRSYLQGKAATIATLKCLGASGALVFRAYLILILTLAVGGVVLGLAIGAAVPTVVAGLLAARMSVDPQVAIFPVPLAIAAAFGLLAALGFSLWPLARARDIRAVQLFRDLLQHAPQRPRRGDLLAIGAVGAALAALVLATTKDRGLAAGFVGGAIVALLLFRGTAIAIAAAARRLNPLTAQRPALRLALANLHRPGAPTGSVVLSLGLGLTVLVAIALVEGNLARQIRETMPQAAPSFYFIDIQPDEAAAFDALVAGFPGVSDLQRVPMLRGRITAMNGVPAGKLPRTGERWVLEGDRGITWSTTVPRGSRIVAGDWWPADYRGPPLISLDREVADAFALKLGDSITVNVMGREITGRIASLRELDWSTLAINFVMIFSPGILEGAPQTQIATARIATDREVALQKAVADRFANVSSIRVKDALEAVARILAAVGDAVRLSASITLLAGILVLGGAIVAGHHRRVYDAVLFKVLGATRADIIRAFLLEYGILGLITGLLAAAAGTLAGYLFQAEVMDSPWTFLPGTVALTALLGTVITLGFGIAGTWWALSRPAAPLLRNE
ncbi:MAG TPA: FtsX-like permease family protein [Methylomirabilota bacterium]|nr:FtsX-like permease family protein [Methylomirabilota bacterium]